MLTIALPKGRIADESLAIFRRICDEDFAFGSRKLILIKGGYRFLLVRSQDVPTYVTHGAADIGICGKDVLLEQNAPVTELMDLGFGRCNVVLGMRKGERLNPSITHIKVATKMINITKRFFAAKAIPVEVIKLYGSIELAPLTGLADAIVDITETGATMRENGLEPIEIIMATSARLFANRDSFIEHKAEILALRGLIAKWLNLKP
ncbi:MAG: ATP phosphoribosyltransferase [Helicobacteraceae bacterium]|jgi:ATP phosphoribosyltransferase|nr:ATP phosphoribosyltransferase [Helicobacteraceae bacterium]